MTKDEALKIIIELQNYSEDFNVEQLNALYTAQLCLDHSEIVRCKDCKYVFNDYHSKYCGKTKMYVESNFYCKYGEKNDY